MKIFKAQKRVKRLKGEIADIQSRMSSVISTLKNNAEYAEDINATYEY